MTNIESSDNVGISDIQGRKFRL
uniref:Uncharacterized protein n=1 Tax=Arundo donax TaxID=35708 RepID=A0A0A9H1U5_ARUDO